MKRRQETRSAYEGADRSRWAGRRRMIGVRRRGCTDGVDRRLVGSQPRGPRKAARHAVVWARCDPGTNALVHGDNSRSNP